MDDKGNDTLNGGFGADTMSGGSGNDTYVVNESDDVIEELAGKGKDTVRSFVSYTLEEGQEIENLILSSGAFVMGVGNSINNVITMTGSGQAALDGEGGNDTVTGGANADDVNGSAGNDVLTGGAGNDEISGDTGKDKLTGGDGDDELDGGVDADVMAGGKGNDLYGVDDAGDKITELAGQGFDTVVSFVANYTLGATLEGLFLDAGAINGTGNALDNVMSGNVGANSLNGLGGRDALSGNDGNDTLKGGAGADWIEGGLGADTLFGEGDKDLFFYGLDNTVDLPLLGGDVINGFQTGVDKIDLSDLLDEFAINAANAFSGGFVLLTKMGSDTRVHFDQDGFAGSGPVTLAIVVGANVATTDLVLDA